MPAAYGASLIELTRRKILARTLTTCLTTLRRNLTVYFSAERRRRESFASEILRYLPAFADEGRGGGAGGFVEAFETDVPVVEVGVRTGVEGLVGVVKEDVYGTIDCIFVLRLLLNRVGLVY
jgi:hypothetical protein